MPADSRAPRYARILLKLSGEALMGEQNFGIDPKVLDRMAVEIGQLISMGVQVGLVVGGGNLFRGAALNAAGLDRDVVLFAAGTGNPFFTTDSAACLRGIEVQADLVLKATKVDGVYTADPKQVAEAVLLESVTFQDVLEQDLGVMDLTAICLCRDHDMPVRVFNMTKVGVLQRLMYGEQEGTLIHGGKA